MRMGRLIWIFTVRACQLVPYALYRLIIYICANLLFLVCIAHALSLKHACEAPLHLEKVGAYINTCVVSLHCKKM